MKLKTPQQKLLPLLLMALCPMACVRANFEKGGRHVKGATDGDEAETGLRAEAGLWGVEAGGDSRHPDNGLDDGNVPVMESCEALAAAGFDYDGLYAVDPDGPGGLAPFDVFCDMVADGGGWALILSSDGSSSGLGFNEVPVLSSVSMSGRLSQLKILALAGVAKDVRISGEGKAVISSDDYAIGRIRRFQGINDQNPRNGADHWTGDVDHMTYLCSENATAGLSSNVYHACGNHSGLHWHAGIRSEWALLQPIGDPFDNLNLWLR